MVGGVAGNRVVINAMVKEFDLKNEIFVPEHFASMAAIGSAMRSIEKIRESQSNPKPAPINLKFEKEEEASLLAPLEIRLSKIGSNDITYSIDKSKQTDVYIGIDIGNRFCDTVGAALVLWRSHNTLAAERIARSDNSLVVGGYYHLFQ